MSIEVSFSPAEQAENHILGQIVPGEIATFTDYSSDSRSVVAVTCYQDDSGGEVHLFENKDFSEFAGLRVIYPENLTQENRVAIILARGKHERDLVTAAHVKGRLVLSHTLANPTISI